MRLYIKNTVLLSLGIAATLGLAACGGGDSGGETPIVVTGQTETLTKDEFITQADALCDTANSQISDIANAGEGITRAADVAALRTGLVSDIRNLGTPVDDSSSSSSTSTGSTTSPTADVSTFPGDSSTTSDTTSATTDTASSGLTSTGSDLEDFLTALAAEAKAGEKIDLANQRGGDTSAGEAELNTAKDKAATAASSYGFQICGTDGTTATDTSSDPTIGTDSSGTSPAAPSTATPVTPSTGSSSGGSSSSGTTDGSSGTSSGGGVSAGGGVGPG